MQNVANTHGITPSSAIVTQYQQLQQRRQRRQRGDSEDEMKKVEMKALRSNVVLILFHSYVR
jgi:hypothetical protein